MHHPLRCVETEDLEGNAVVIITNAFKQSAEEIGDIYIYRWQIELFSNGSSNICRLNISTVIASERWKCNFT